MTDAAETTEGHALVPAPSGADSWLPQLQAFEEFASKRLKVVADEVDNRTDTTVAVFGIVVITAGLLFQVNFAGYRISDLAPSEFITVMVVGLFLVALGAARRAFQLRGVVQVETKTIEEGARLAGATRGVGTDPTVDRS